MAIRPEMTDDHFDALIRNPEMAEQAMPNLSPEEKAYLRDRFVAVARHGWDSQALKSARRKREIQEPKETTKGLSTYGPGVLEAWADFLPKAGKLGLAVAGLPGGEVPEAASQWARRQQKMNEEGQLGLAPLATPEEKEDAELPSIAKTALSTPTSIANLVAAPVMMGAEAVGAGANLLGSSGAQVMGDKDKARELHQRAVEQGSTLGGALGEMATHALYDLPKAILHAGAWGTGEVTEGAAELVGLQDYVGIEEWARHHEMTPDDLITMIEEDPIGNALFVTGYLHGAVKVKAKAAKLRTDLQVARQTGEKPKAGMGPDTYGGTFERARGNTERLGGERVIVDITDPVLQERALETTRKWVAERQAELDAVKGGKLRPDEHAALYDEAIRQEQAKLLHERKGQGKTELTTIDEFDTPAQKAHGKALKKLANVLEREQARLRALRDERVDPVRPAEIAEVAKKFPVAYNAAKTKLLRAVEMFTPNTTLKFADLKKALVDELSLIHPTLTRAQIRNLMRKHAANYEKAGGVVNTDVAWALEEISRARAKRGQSNTPITAPVGRWSKTRLDVLNRASERLQKFWESDIRGGDDLAKPRAFAPEEGAAPPQAKRVAKNKMPGEYAPVEYDGKFAGQELWTVLEDKHGFTKGQRVTTKMLEDLGYKIDRPTFPKATGKEGPVSSEPISKILMDEAIDEGMPVVAAQNLLVQSQAKTTVNDFLSTMLEATRPITMRVDALGKQGTQFLDAANAYAASGGHSGVMTTMHVGSLKARMAQRGMGDAQVNTHLRTACEFLADQKRQAAILRREEALAIIEEMDARKAAGETLTKDQQAQLEWAEEIDVDTNIPAMDPARVQRWKQTQGFKLFNEWWMEEVQKYVEDFADDAGITADLYTPDGYYVKSVYETDPAAIGPQSKLVTTEYGRSGSSVQGKLPQRAKSARVFKGRMARGQVITLDMNRLLGETLKDRTQAAAKNNLLGELEALDHTNRADGTFRAGDRVTDPKSGKSYILESIETLEMYKNTGLIKRRNMLVPKEVAEVYNHLVKMERDTSFHKFVEGWKGLVTGAALLTPAEGVMHAANLMHTAAMAADWGLGKNVGKKLGGGLVGKAAELGTTYGTTIGRLSGLFYDMMTQDQATIARSTERLSRVGGLRTRDMAPRSMRPKRLHKTAVGRGIATATEVIAEKTGLHAIKQGIFGMPDLSFKISDLKNPMDVFKPKTWGKWLKTRGIETRIRISLLEAFERVDPGKTDAQYANMINNVLGTYTHSLVPQLTQAAMMVDPFARAGTAHIKYSAQLAAKAGIVDPIRAARDMASGNFEARLYANTLNSYASVVGIIVLNKLLLDQIRGKESGGGWWPWSDDEKAKLYYASVKPGDIALPLPDGRRVDIPMRVFSNTLFRGMNNLGVMNVLKAYQQGETNPVTLGQEMSRGWINTVLSRTGPFLRMPFQGSTLSALYMTDIRPPKLMELGTPTMSGSDAAQQHAAQFFAPMLPIPHKAIPQMFGSRKFDAEAETPFWKGIRMGLDMSGLHMPLRQKNFEYEVSGMQAAKREKLLSKTAFAIANGAMRLPDHKRDEFIREELNKRFDESEQGQLEMLKAVTIIFNTLEGKPDRMMENIEKDLMYREGITPGTLE